MGPTGAMSPGPPTKGITPFIIEECQDCKYRFNCIYHDKTEKWLNQAIADPKLEIDDEKRIMKSMLNFYSSWVPKDANCKDDDNHQDHQIFFKSFIARKLWPKK